MRTAILLLVLGLAAAAAAVVLLQRGDDEGGPRLPPAELTRQAGRVCAELARENMRLEPPPRPYTGQAAEFFEAATANVADAQARLAGLRAADDATQERLDALVERYDLAEDKLEQAQAAASVEQDSEVLALLAELRVLTGEMAGLEGELGICPAGTSARVGILQAVERTSAVNPLGETGPLVPGGQDSP